MVGMKDSSLLTAFGMPIVREFYSNCLDVLRTGARHEGLHTILELNKTANSENVRLQAAKYLDSEGQSDKTQVQVNVGVVNAPGYSIQMNEDQAERARQIAKQAGSTSNVLDHKP